MPVKRNVAWWARSGRRKFFFSPKETGKRNLAWVARTGGRSDFFAPQGKRFDDSYYGDYNGYDNFEHPDIDYATDEIVEPYALEKRNIASLVNSKTIPSFITGYKRHIGTALRYRSPSSTKYSVYSRPDKRYFASLLKSEHPPNSLYSRMNRRYQYFPDNVPSKRFFNSLLENDYGPPGEEVEKRNFGSLLKSTAYKGKRGFASLLKSDSGVGTAGKRSFSSILDNTKSDNKRFVGSLLKSTALQNTEMGPSNQILGSIYDMQGHDFEKRNFASLINRNNPYSRGKRHVGSLVDTSKRFYGSILDNSQDEDKRSVGSLLKSSSYRTPGKKHVGSALRYRPDKRDPDYDPALSDEEVQLDALDKRFVGSLMDSTAPNQLYSHSPGKRHFASLLDSPDLRSLNFGPLEENEEKRHFASLLDSRTQEAKRFVGSLKNSDTPYLGFSEGKRFLGSAINSRMMYKNDDKRFLGSAINSRMNFMGQQNNEKRFGGSEDESENKEDNKRFYASVLDNSRKTDGEHDKRFAGSAKFTPSQDSRSKRNASETNAEENESHSGRHKRSLEYYDYEELTPPSGSMEVPRYEFVPDFETASQMDFGNDSDVEMPVKKFLRKYILLW